MVSVTRRAFVALLAGLGAAVKIPLPPPVLDSAGFPLRDEAGNVIRQQ